MGCYHPIPAHQDEAGGEVTLWPPVGTATMNLPCGGCLGCKTTHATDWARRAEHEASQWEHNSFVTLTYNQAKLPKEGHLEPQALQHFIKRLRRTRDRNHPDILSDRRGGLRYLACGEYGERNNRPHYHLLLFNCGFRDTFNYTDQLGHSLLVEQLWPQGHNTIGTVTGASANYVAQYTLKKQGKSHCDTDGVIKPAPFLRMSLKPAIGAQWIQKNKRDITHGYLVTNGTKGRIPRTYKTILRRTDPQLVDRAVENGSKMKRPQDNLVAAEKIHQARKALAEHRHL